MPYRTKCQRFSLLLLLLAACGVHASDTQFQTEHFSGSGNCATCHDGMRAADGATVSFGKSWAATMMANSARDPYWQAKVASELAQHPQLADTISEKCLRCHAPMAAIEAELQVSPIEVLGSGVLEPGHPLHDAAMDGVSCTACHQLQPANVEESHSGQFEIDPNRRVAFGPRTDPRRNPMAFSSGFTPVHGAHMADSSVCAGCHTLKTPFVDGHGSIASTTPDREFPEQMPYVEWQHSDFGPGGDRERSCQSCHMPRRDGVPLANRPRWLASRDDVAEHDFLGANTLMLEILDTHAEELGVPPADFQRSIALNRAFLQQGVDLDIQRAALVDGELRLDVKVVNNSGHKFPTGYPSRRAYLHVLVKDAAGATVFESGRVKPDGMVVGINADTDPRKFEPHFNTLRRAWQVQVYEAVMGDTDGKVTHSLLRAASYLKDNRIPPAGFDKESVPADIAVVGKAAADSDFTGGADTVRYRLPLSAVAPLTVQVELNYQAIAFASFRQLRDSADDPAIRRFTDFFLGANNKTETIASAEVVVQP
jgi:hypothetical protein